MSAFSQFFLGSPAQATQLPTLTDQQKQLIQQLLGGLGGPLSSGLGNLQNILSGSPEAMSAFERPALRQFGEQIVPGIAERFAGVGGGSSSGFQQTMGRAGERLAESLQAQRSGLQQNALSQLQGLLGIAQQPQFQYQQSRGSEGALPSLLSMLGMAAGGAFGGPGGAMAGGAAGRGFGNLFSRNKNSFSGNITSGLA